MIKNILYSIAGVDKETIAACSSSEKNKFAILGSLVAIPIVTSSLATAFCLRFYTGNILVILLSCLASAFVMFIVERGLIASLRPKTFSLAVVMRVLLAVAMSMIVAELLTVAIFNGDIYRYFQEEQAAKYERIYSSGDRKLAELKAEIAASKAAKDAKEKAFHDEMDGNAGTYKSGHGPSAQAKELALNLERQSHEEVKARVESEMARTRAHYEELVAEAKENSSLGILASIEALHSLAGEDSLVAWALIVFHIFFLFLELMPLTIKLSYDGTLYYDIQDLQDQQQLDIVRVTSDERSEVLKLESQCELRQRELAIRLRMARNESEYRSALTIDESKVLFETLKTLEEQAIKSDRSLTKENAAAFNKQLVELFDRYIDGCLAAAA